MIGPKKVPDPPTITISRMRNDRISVNEPGSMNCTSGAWSAPASPPRAEPMAKARSVVLVVSRPSEFARIGFSRRALNARPQGERSSHASAPATIRKHPSVK